MVLLSNNSKLNHKYKGQLPIYLQQGFIVLSPMNKTLLLQFLLVEGTSMLGEVGYTFFTGHPCLTTFCGCTLGCLFLVYLCLLNPLNGHLIV
jgi:hypothetical protein